MRNVVPTMGKKSLKVYSHDLNNWNLDNNVCKTNTKFQRAWLKTTIGNTPIYIHNPNDDIWISKNLLMNGHWEADFVSLVFNLLLKDNAHDIQFVDLGANIGVFTLAVAKLGVKVIAVEPLSINLQRLCKSVEEGISEDGAPFADRVTIIHNALSDVRENVQLGKDQQNVGGTYVLKDSNERKVQGSVVNGKYNDVVMTAKLDDLLQLPNFDFKKVILKIDVEGYESKVFNGGQAFFNTVDVQAVLMEWRWHKGAKDIQSLLDFFTSRKYKPFNPKQTNPTPLQISDTQKWPGDVLWKK
jgi:FkbM family methyltransferase